MWRKIPAALPAVTMLVLAVFAVLKLADLREFDRALATWSLLPPGARKALVVLIPTVELTISLLYLAGIGRRAAAMAACAFLIAAAGTYGAHLAMGKSPECGCAGVLQQFAWARAEGWRLIGRNAVLAVLCVPGFARRRGPSRLDEPAAGRAGRLEGAPGFTLVELLVVIAVTALLVGLALSAFARVRESSRRARTLSWLSSHARSVEAYASDSRAYLPYYGDPTGLAEWRSQDCPTVVRYPYFVGAHFWHSTMGDQYTGGAAKTLSPHGVAPSDCMSWFLFSSSLRARPEFWNALTRTGPEQWLAVRMDEVTFPAAKVEFKDGSLTEDERREGLDAIAACDGHARWVKPGGLLPGYPDGEGDWFGSWFIRDDPGMHTIDGARGRDLTSP